MGTGLATSVPDQALPFGLVIDPNEQISIVFSSTNLTNVVINGLGFITQFDASGTGSISGTLVPEPSSLVMATLAGVGLALAALRIRRR